MPAGRPKKSRQLSPRTLAELRGKIRATCIIKRLQRFIDGEIDLPPAAVTAALGLLHKVLPSLSAQAIVAHEIDSPVDFGAFLNALNGRVLLPGDQPGRPIIGAAPALGRPAVEANRHQPLFEVEPMSPLDAARRIAAGPHD